jgi:hypothetical protein
VECLHPLYLSPGDASDPIWNTAYRSVCRTRESG